MFSRAFCLYVKVSDHLCGYTADNGIFRNILCDYGTGGNDRIVANGDAGKDCSIGTDPDISADPDGAGKIGSPAGRMQIVIDGSQYHVVTDQGVITNVDTALILKTAAGIEENIFPDVDIHAAVGVKGWEQVEAVGNTLSGQMGYDFSDFLRCMISIVQFHGDFQGALSKRAHKAVNFGAWNNGMTAVGMVQKCLICSLYLSAS